MMDLLEVIKNFADKAHGEQIRKYSGARYIVHPIAVMNICAEYTQDISVLSAALLHDVLEDTDVKPFQLKEFLYSLMDPNQADRTFMIVKDLTDVYINEHYPHYNRKKRKRLEAQRLSQADPHAQTVKYADLIDNCLDIIKNDKHFAVTFLRESEMFLQMMIAGNPELYLRAKNVVEYCKKILK